MPIKKKYTKILYRKSLTINEILYPNFKTIKDEEKVKYGNDINLYRDIFRFIFSDYELKIGEDIRKVKVEEVTFIDSFKLWPLCKWLLANNRELIDEFKDNRTPIAYRPHLIQGRIALRLEKLHTLRLFNIDEKKVKQTRNRDQKTDLYHIEKIGLLVALTLQLQKCDKNSEDFKKILRLALEKYLEVIGDNYKNNDNYHYYFLKSMLNECVNEYNDILQYFFDYIAYRSLDPSTNFSVLRYNINNKFFKKIINDDDFKLLFYNTLNNFETPYISNLSQHNNDNKKLFEIEQIKPHEARQMIKVYFKLDVETQIDREFSDFLENNIALNKSPPDTDKQIENCGSEELIETDVVSYEIVEQQHHMVDYKMRNKWDKERIDNLSNSNKITLVVKCAECLQIYPYLFDIEEDLLKKIPCLFCKKNSLKYYDLKNELEKLFPDEKILRFK